MEDARSLSDTDLARIEEIALKETYIAGRLVVRDGQVAGIAINIVLGKNSDAAEMEVSDYLNAFLDRARASHPEFAICLTGTAIGNRVVADATKDDLENLAPLAFHLTVAITAILLRSAFATDFLLLPTLLKTIDSRRKISRE